MAASEKRQKREKEAGEAKEMPQTVYFLELEGDPDKPKTPANRCYYVGTVEQPKEEITMKEAKELVDIRYAKHVAGADFGGARWTTVHPPRRILQVIPNQDRWRETTLAIEKMCELGFENVRGGPWCKVAPLEDYQIEIIHGMWMTRNGFCNICQEKGHFAAVCNKVAVDPSPPLRDVCTTCYKAGHLESKCPNFVPTCYTCGELGHISPQCPHDRGGGGGGGGGGRGRGGGWVDNTVAFATHLFGSLDPRNKRAGGTRGLAMMTKARGGSKAFVYTGKRKPS